MRANQFEPREKAIKIGQTILGLSFFLPYLIVYHGAETSNLLVIYSPIWMIIQSDYNIVGGPTPMALLMFTFWLPYVLVGYQAYRYAKGNCSSGRSYLLGILLLTIVAILMLTPMLTIPSGFVDGSYIYPLVIPFPIISLLASVSFRVMAPTKIEIPWSEEPEETESVSDEQPLWTDSWK